MIYEPEIAHKLYKKLLTLYPRTFKEQLGESMEQTFHDLWNEKRRTKKDLFGFVLWTFIETALGIVREYLLLIAAGDRMQTTLKTIRSSALISVLLVIPFMIMEVVNRRNFHEDFPILLFFGMWFNLFAISLILLPIVQGKRIGNHEVLDPVPAQGKTLLIIPRWAAMIGVVLVLSLLIVPLLNSLGWVPVEHLLNEPGQAQPSVFGVQVPGQFIAFVLLSLPIVAGIIAGAPVVKTLRGGGSLFTHPINLIIVILILSTFVIGLANILIDQWPCFIGVPNCD